MENLNWLDISILVILGFSGLIACFRGLLRELLSLASWTIASIAAVGLTPYLMPFLSKQLGEGKTTEIIGTVIIFIATIVICTLVTVFITNRVRQSSLSGLDRSLGLLFGIIRGGVLITLAYIFVSIAMPREIQPEIIKNARTFNAFGFFAKKMVDLAPEKQKTFLKQALEEKETSKEKQSKKEKVYDMLSKEKTNKKDKTGYKKEERESLDDLIKSNILETQSLPEAK